MVVSSNNVYQQYILRASVCQEQKAEIHSSFAWRAGGPPWGEKSARTPRAPARDFAPCTPVYLLTIIGSHMPAL